MSEPLNRAESLSRVAERLSVSTTLDEAIRVVCEETARVLVSRTVVVQLYEPETGELRARYGHGVTGGMREPAAAPYEVVRSSIAAFGRVHQIADLQSQPGLHFEDQVRANDVRSLAYAAFVHGDVLLGLLNVVSHGTPSLLSDEEMLLLKGIADQTVGALVRARLLMEKESIEAKLFASERRYREIVETSHDGICMLDLDGRFRFANRRLAEILEATVDELIGTTVFDQMLFDDPVATKQRLLQRASGEGRRLELPLRLRNGREIWAAVVSTPAHENDVLVGVTLVISDITEAHRLREKLQRAQKAESLGVMAGGIAHDFNNLLVSVLGNAGIALVELPTESPVRPVVEDILAAALRAADLTKQLLAYSGKGRLELTRVDLGRVIEEMSHLASRVIPKSAELRFALADDLPPIEGDESQLRQVVMNLVSNAADALGDASGVIAVTTSLRDVDRSYLAEAHLETDLEPGPYVVLSVSDTGTGMSLQTRAKIFDPFFSTKFAGRGLGLAASVGIVHAHRGAIKVESAVGRGSTFTVLFPARPALAPPSRVEIAPTTEAWRGSGTLLVVDDDESVRGITKRILTLHGFEVLVASDGIDAIDVFEKNAARIRAVVLDMTMPRMGGEEAFRALRRIAPEVRVLLMSGYDEQEATTRFKDQGIAGFLPKPFVAGELMARLRRVLGE